MDTKVLITIDTEPDNQWDISLRKHPRFENISKLDKLQKLIDKFHAKPTYLVSFSVVNCEAINLLKDINKSKKCEIGTHLHTWETPPFGEPLKGDGSYLHQYPFGLQEEKLKNLDALITETFGNKPVSYRGGRYSFDKNTVILLSKFGYFVDTSVTPGVSWENDGGTNFKKFCRDDYLFQEEKKEGLLEVPVTIRIKTKFPRVANFIYLNTPNWTHAEGMLRRLAAFDIVWLDPSFNEFEDMKYVCDMLLAEKARYLNIMFHSSVIVPGGSPYTLNEEKTEKFFARLEKLMDYLLKVKRLESLSLKEFYEYRKNYNYGWKCS